MVHKKTLTTDEKLRFVQQHKLQLDRKALGQALGLTDGQVESYLRVSELPEEVIEDCKTQKKGRERGSTEIETASLIARNKNEDIQKLLSSHARNLINRGTTDRERRTEIREKVKKINELSQHKDVLRMSEREIAKIVIERPRNTLRSLLKISEGSEGKYKAFWDLLESEKFEEVIIFNPTTPYLVDAPASKSEALLTVEYSREKSFTVILVERSLACADLWKKETKNDKNVNVIGVSAEEYLISQLRFSTKKTLIYFNLAGDRNDREFYSKESFRSIKIKRPQSIIAFIITEEFTNPTNKDSNYLELLRAFGIETAKRIRTVEDYLRAYNYRFKILWEKKISRRVVLVSLSD